MGWVRRRSGQGTSKLPGLIYRFPDSRDKDIMFLLTIGYTLEGQNSRDVDSSFKAMT